MVSRKEIRQKAMELIFQMEIQNDFSDDAMNKFLKNYSMPKSQTEYFMFLFEKLISNKNEIDNIIEKHSKNWAVSRLARVDLSILRVAITEMIFIKDIPIAVSINEAIELAKIFGTDNSPKFINGVLAGVTGELEEK